MLRSERDMTISDSTIKKMKITGVRLRAHQMREMMGLNNEYSYEEYKAGVGELVDR